MAERTPWAGWLAVAIELGVAPAAFWRLSLREWRALVAPTDASLSRAAFEALARRFPDDAR
ncbi:MAG: phage tail assembly chaperone [Hyphomonadaceae bacterium]|nr:phage tail assembly chaperone [Hyphomonadaceae bacterium]